MLFSTVPVSLKEPNIYLQINFPHEMKKLSYIFRICCTSICRSYITVCFCYLCTFHLDSLPLSRIVCLNVTSKISQLVFLFLTVSLPIQHLWLLILEITRNILYRRMIMKKYLLSMSSSTLKFDYFKCKRNAFPMGKPLATLSM